MELLPGILVGNPELSLSPSSSPRARQPAVPIRVVETGKTVDHKADALLDFQGKKPSVPAGVKKYSSPDGVFGVLKNKIRACYVVLDARLMKTSFFLF
jgi:hypothetical protein